MIVDYLILGGGSAGCVLAARLSADPRRTVVLVEAGRNISADDIPDEVRGRYPGRAYLDARNIWSHLTALMGHPRSNTAPRPPRRYEQARLLGGGSAINALMANRGAPADYAEWQALGADGWGWCDCLPYFLKIEADRDFDGPLHGADGPLTIRRISDDRISPFVDRVMKTLNRRGHPIKPDQNGAWEDGVFRGAIAVSDSGERLPTSVAYLTADVRKRPRSKDHHRKRRGPHPVRWPSSHGREIDRCDGGDDPSVGSDCLCRRHPHTRVADALRYRPRR